MTTPPPADHEEIGPPPLSAEQRRLALAVVGVHTPVSILGTALAPYLVVHQPLVLIALSPEIHHLVLAAPQVSALWLLPVGTLRRVTVMAAMYAVGALWGFIAVRWAGRRSPRAARIIAFTETLFGRVGLPLLVVAPTYALGLVAGASRAPVPRFLLATTLGQALATGLTIWAGDALGVWVDAVLRWLEANVVVATAVCAAVVLGWQLWQRRPRRRVAPGEGGT